MIRKALSKVRNKAFMDTYKKLQELDQKLSQHELMLNHVMFTANKLEGELEKHPVIMPISSSEVMVKIFNGIKFSLDPRDISVATHIAMDGVWEEFITKAWMSVIRDIPEAVILDVGANFGYFGALAAHGVNRKKSKIVLFEPNPHLLPYINKTLSTNWLNENVKVENLGIADKSGQFELNILKDYVGSSTMQSAEQLTEYVGDKMHVEVAEKVKVQTVTIDEYCAGRDIESIDLIKMDIEGFEEKAYEGMRNMVAKSHGLTLFLEFTKQSYEAPEAFYNKVRGDFKFMYTIAGDGSFVEPANTDYHAMFNDVDDWIMLVFSQRPLV